MHFGQIPRVPGDPILGLMDLYRADTNPAKLDLGVGVYKDAQGLTPIPRAVKLAEQRLVDSEQTKSYIGGHGDAQFGALLLRQVLGSRAIALGEQRAGCTQAPGGTGALRLAGEFIAKCLPGRSIWLSDPTWPIHETLFAAAGLRPHLRHAGGFQAVHGLERLGHGLAHRQQAVVAQDQVIVAAQVAHQARLFFGVQRQPLVVVIAQRSQRDEGKLRQGQQAVFLRRHGHAVDGVRVQHAHRVLAGRMDTAVDGEAGRVDVVFRIHHLVAVQVDLDQAGRRDLVEHHAVGIDQEVLGARHLGGDVREDQVVPAK